MKRFKIISLSISIVLVIIVLPLLLVIIPINAKHSFLNKEEKILKIAEKKSARISKAIINNSKNAVFLQENLQEKPILSFIEEALNSSQLSMGSIKPGQGNEHNEIHVVLKGEFRALLKFISLISTYPNSIAIINLSIEKNHIEIIFKDNDKTIAPSKTQHHPALLKRLSSALTFIEIPDFTWMPGFTLKDVQSPFAPRIWSEEKNSGPLQSLMGCDWHLTGEVRRKDVLLGVFLGAASHSQSYYFGVDLPWKNSDWRVISITPAAVVFENSKSYARWHLFYQST